MMMPGAFATLERSKRKTGFERSAILCSHERIREAHPTHALRLESCLLRGGAVLHQDRFKSVLSSRKTATDILETER